VGTYRVVKKIATGGMAEVFLARMVGAEGFEKPVAVKRILPSLAQDSHFIDLFLREARVSVALQHTNVVQVLDLGSSQNQYYMVMEFVDGENLRALLKVARLRKVSLGIREVCFIVQQVAEGLAYAHARTDPSGSPLNIIHRDINPSNVMIASTGEVKLTDFGIAKVADDYPETQTGLLKGKINYLSPEQVLGRTVDQRSDIFLLGLLLYELLAGRQLFEGASLQVVQQIGAFDERGLQPIPGMPMPLWTLLLKSLAASPSSRIRTARELADALQGFLFEHRMRVGSSDIAQLFTRLFPERHSPLEDLKSGKHEAEIKLESREAARTPAQAPAPPPQRAEPRRPAPASPPPVLRPSQSLPVPPALAAQAAGPKPRSSEPPRLGPEDPSRPATPAAVPRPTTPPPARTGRRIGDILVARGVLSAHKLEDGLALQKKRPGQKLGHVLVAEDLVNSEEMTRALAEQASLPYITDDRLQAMEVPPEDVLKLVPQELCERLCAVPVVLRGKELYCAVLEPRDLKALDALKFAVGPLSVQGILASDFAIRRAIRRFYTGRGSLLELDDSDIESPTRERMLQFAERFMGRQMLQFEEEQLADAVAPQARASSATPPAGPASAHATPPSATATLPHLPELSLGTGPRPRLVLVVADAPELREATARLLLQQGFTAGASSAANVEEALALGGHELVLLAEDAVEAPKALAARLRAAHPNLDVRVLPFGASLLGEGGPLARLRGAQSKLLDGALALLGGSAALAPFLVRLTRGTAARLGASSLEEALVGTAAQALALAARAEEPKIFILPPLMRVRTLLGGEHPEVLELLASILTDTHRDKAPLGRLAAATLSAAAFLLQVQSAQPGPTESAQALAGLRKDPRLPGAVLEALANELAESMPPPAGTARVVVLEPDAAMATALQLRLKKEGLSVHFTHSRAEAERALASGVQAGILASPLPDGDVNALLRSLRAAPATATLPLFLLAAREDTEEVTAGLEAGADDVLVRPVSVEVLAAKLRRAIAQHQAVLRKANAN
jgi:serine/threonine-protein kinase